LRSGPLKANWLFPFENLGGVIKDYLHGTSNGFESMMEIFLLTCSMPEIESFLPATRMLPLDSSSRSLFSVPEAVEDCLDKMNYKFAEPRGNGYFPEGKSHIRTKNSLPLCVQELVPDNATINYCTRLTANGIFFHSKEVCQFIVLFLNFFEFNLFISYFFSLSYFVFTSAPR
jgi:hypothetical protein